MDKGIYKIIERKYSPNRQEELELWSRVDDLVNRVKKAWLAHESFVLSEEEVDSFSFMSRSALKILTECDVLEHIPDKGWRLGPCAYVAGAGTKYPEMPSEIGSYFERNMPPDIQCCPEFIWITIHVLECRLKLLDDVVDFLNENLNLNRFSGHLYNESFLECFRPFLMSGLVRGNDVLFPGRTFYPIKEKLVNSRVHQVYEDIKNLLKHSGPILKEDLEMMAWYDFGKNGNTDRAFNKLINNPKDIKEVKFRGKTYVYVSDNTGKELVNGENEFVTHDGNFFGQGERPVIYPFMGWGSWICFSHPGTILEGNTCKSGDKPFVIKTNQDGEILKWTGKTWEVDENLPVGDSCFRIIRALIL